MQPRTSETGTRSMLVWICLAIAAALHALGALVPGGWLWGAAPIRWVPIVGWALWVAFVVVLLPGAGRRAEGLVKSRLGTWCSRRFPGILAGALALLVLLLPDRVYFVGDFLLRQGTAEVLADPGRVAPQALPLEVALTYELPVALARQFNLPPNATARLLGVLSAGLLALAAVALSRRLVPQAPGWRWAIAIALTFGGWCTLFTGYSKAFVELTWIVLWAAVLAVDAEKKPQTFLWLSALVVVGLLLHRAALGLLPVWGYLAWEHYRRGGKSLGAAIVGAAPVLLVLFWSGVRVWEAFGETDRGHFDPRGLAAPLRSLDLANGALALVPLVPLAVVAIREWRSFTNGMGRLLVLTALPYLALALVLQPSQGVFRDLDTFAMSGVALAILLSAGLASAVRQRAVASWLAVPVAAGAIAFTSVALAWNSDLDAGLARVEGWLAGPPPRTNVERALALDFLGVRAMRAGRYEESSEYLRRAAQLAPTPRLLLEWAVAAETARDTENMRKALEAILERSDQSNYGQFRIVAHIGLAKLAAGRGDRAEFALHAAEARRIAPGNPMLAQILRDARARGLTPDTLSTDTLSAPGPVRRGTP